MTIRGVRNWTIAFAIGFAGTTAALAANDFRRQSGEELGPIDFFAFCRMRYGAESTAMLDRESADGWRCVVNERLWGLRSIDTDEACTVNYGEAAYGRSSDPASPYSWTCYRA